MDNNIPIDHPSTLKALKEVALELKLNQELDRLESFPENKSDLDRAQVEELLSISEILYNKAKEYGQKNKSDFAKDIIEILEGYVIRKDTKPTGKSERTIKRNQKIIDECYRLEKEGLKSKIVYERIANNYPELSEHSIKKIRFSHDSPSPTELKPKKK